MSSEVEFSCITDGCKFLPVKEAPVLTSGLYACTRHSNIFHLCRSGLQKQSCILDEEGCCLITGKRYLPTKSARFRFYGNGFLANSPGCVIARSVRRSVEDQRASSAIAERYTRYPFWVGIKNYLNENLSALPSDFNPTSALVESMIRRSHALFQETLHADRERLQLTETRRLVDSERRYREVCQSILEHLTDDRAVQVDLNTKLGTNRKVGAEFRRDIGILVSYDVANPTDLVPPLYRVPSYVHRRERWLETRQGIAR